jgi:shikimate dehydrogenase
MTSVFAEVIGDPIDHSLSPAIHGHWLAMLGIDGEYRANRVVSGAIPDYLDRRRADTGWRGCNVTLPHKEAVVFHLDAVEPQASRIGAVNTVVRQEGGRLLGVNTDIDGIEAALGGQPLDGRRVTVIGAGGAARAAYALLAKKGCARVSVLARSPRKAEQAARECRLAKAKVFEFQPRSGALQESALLINATQLGMTGQEAMPQFVLDEMKTMAEGALVFDMVYTPLETALIAHARSRELAVADGLTMLIGQAATAFERFFGRPPPADDAALRSLLAR